MRLSADAKGVIPVRPPHTPLWSARSCERARARLPAPRRDENPHQKKDHAKKRQRTSSKTHVRTINTIAATNNQNYGRFAPFLPSNSLSAFFFFPPSSARRPFAAASERGGAPLSTVLRTFYTTHRHPCLCACRPPPSPTPKTKHHNLNPPSNTKKAAPSRRPTTPHTTAAAPGGPPRPSVRPLSPLFVPHLASSAAATPARSSVPRAPRGGAGGGGGQGREPASQPTQRRRFFFLLFRGRPALENNPPHGYDMIKKERLRDVLLPFSAPQTPAQPLPIPRERGSVAPRAAAPAPQPRERPRPGPFNLFVVSFVFPRVVYKLFHSRPSCARALSADVRERERKPGERRHEAPARGRALSRSWSSSSSWSTLSPLSSFPPALPTHRSVSLLGAPPLARRARKKHRRLFVSFSPQGGGPAAAARELPKASERRPFPNSQHIKHRHNQTSPPPLQRNKKERGASASARRHAPTQEARGAR